MGVIRDKLIEAGVENLHQYGYPKCDAQNILTDEIYSAFFDSMLRDNIGYGEQIDIAIKGLREEIRQANKSAEPLHVNAMSKENEGN